MIARAVSTKMNERKGAKDLMDATTTRHPARTVMLTIAALAVSNTFWFVELALSAEWHVAGRFTLERLKQIHAQTKYPRTTKLMRAALRCEKEKVRMLLDQGADVNAVTEDGRTALMLAAGSPPAPPTVIPPSNFLNHEEDCERMRRLRSQLPHHPEFMDEYIPRAQDPHCRAQVVQLLLDSGANVRLKDQDGWTALMCAARRGWAAVIRQLLEKGADVNESNSGRDTPLILSAMSSSEAVRLLIEAGAKVNAVGKNGRTALLVAARWGCPETVRILLKRGADAHARDKFGRTALTEAAGTGRHKEPLLFIQQEEPREEVVRMLLAAGVDVNAKDKNGDTALQIARRSCWDNIPYVLVGHGAKE